jgi:Tfp pilus assembly protein PilF
MVAIVDGSIEPTDRAVKIAAADPEAHYTRALSLVNAQRLPEAVAELKIATQLRPHHYYEWLDLGVTLDRLGDTEGAIAALNQSIGLAPGFAQPHWQLGNLLYREGDYEKAFDQMRLAAKSDPSLFEQMLGLAWVAANSDMTAFERLVQPQTKRSYLELSRYLAKQERPQDAVTEAHKAGGPESEADFDLLRQIVVELLSAREFYSAFEVWKISHPGAASDHVTLINGDFISPVARGDPGFGWQLADTVKNLAVSVDPAGPSANSRSLRLDFGGDLPVNIALVTQLALSEPKTRYSLKFSAKTQALVTGGPPVVVVLDASADPAKLLAQSAAITAANGEWSEFQVDFLADGKAVLISVVRTGCTQGACPIFGRLWLSRFSIGKA